MGVGSEDQPAPPAGTGAPGRPGSPWTWRARALGSAIALGAVAAVVTTMVRAGVGMHPESLATSWQLVDLPTLTRDPLGSVWYLHIQPPLHNLVVGSVLRWSPFPAMGTLMVLYVLALGALALLLTDVLCRWRVHPVAAGSATALALLNPNLLATVVVHSYEVPVTLLLVGSIWWFQRQLQRPGLTALLGLAVTLTALTMTRGLFHPAFVVVVVVLAAVARRAPWQHLAVALAVPVLVIGGWMVKNDVLFGTPTMSSWLGFNLQRGVTAPMERDQVEADVADGQVSPLALEYPWMRLDQYAEVGDDCTPTHDHRAVSDARKRGMPERFPNYNAECYLPLYQQAERDAVALVERHPGRYLRIRGAVVANSFSMAPVGLGRTFFGPADRPPIEPTWMDRLGDDLLLPVDINIDQTNWNLRLLGDDFPVRVSVTLAVLALGLLVRGGLGAVRLARSGRRDRAESWDTDELVWLLVTLSAVLVILVGDLVEFGENGRFRAMLDPLLVALPLGAVARMVGTGARRWSARSEGRTGAEATAGPQPEPLPAPPEP